MKDEMKEILDYFKKYVNDKYETYTVVDRHTQNLTILLNYITNLQEENKQLKEQLEYLRSNEYLNQVKWERTFNEELVKDLQQRIDKAIEYIKENSYFKGNAVKTMIYQDYSKYILEILGDDKDE